MFRAELSGRYAQTPSIAAFAFPELPPQWLFFSLESDLSISLSSGNNATYDFGMSESNCTKTECFRFERPRWVSQGLFLLSLVAGDSILPRPKTP